MIFFYIIFALILLIAALLMLSVRLTIKFGEKTYIGIGTLFFEYKLAPLTEKKKRMNKKTSAKKRTVRSDKADKKSVISEFTDDLVISDFLTLLRKLFFQLRKYFFGHIRVRLRRFEITVSDDYADSAALLYGTVSASVSWLLEFLIQNTNLHPLEKSSVFVKCDFNSKKTKADIYIDVKIKVWHLVKMAAVFFPDFIKLKETKNNKSTLKGTE